MATSVVELEVFVGSPSDVEVERERIVGLISRLNRLLKPVVPVRVAPIMYEDHVVPGFGEDMQDVVNKQTGSYDIFLGVMWARVGSRTGRAQSGTVEEFDRALAAFRDRGSPHIMFYFKQAPVPRELLAQAYDVAAFRQTVERNGGLPKDYVGVDDFEDKVLDDLYLHIVRTYKAAELQLGRQEAAVSGDAPDDSVEEREKTSSDATALRLRLESKLAWVCKHLLAGPDTITYATIGSLNYDGYLQDNEARIASQILALDPMSIAKGEHEELADFLQGAEPIVTNFRGSVFDGFARKELAAAGWTVDDFDQPAGYRSHFVAEKDGHRLRVAARLVTSRESQICEREVQRLERSKSQGDGPHVDARAVVIPDASEMPTGPVTDDPRVVKLGDLLRER
jgi:hypothetical protein